MIQYFCQMNKLNSPNDDLNTGLYTNYWSGSYRKSKKKHGMLNYMMIRLDPFVKLIIYFLVFLIISSDNNEFYIKKVDKLNNNVEFYLFNLFKSNRLKFTSASASAKGKSHFSLICFMSQIFYFCFYSHLVCGEFISGVNQNTKGVFKYDASTLQEGLSKNESFICQYKFIAKKNEKVLIKFNKFDVKSIAPDCMNEYVDIYIELTEDQISTYYETPFLSRWCGWKKPEYKNNFKYSFFYSNILKLHICSFTSVLLSFENVIVIAYHKDWIDRGTTLFGTYEFVDAGKNILT